MKLEIFFSSYLTTCGFQFFLPLHFLFTHTLKQPHKCHYKIENTPSFLYTNVQATYIYSSLYSISKSNIIILEKT